MKSNNTESDSARIGLLFSKKRDNLGLSIEDIAKSIKVNTFHLEAIENGDYSKFPSEGFARAYFIKYSNYLSLDCSFPSDAYKKDRENEIIERSVTWKEPFYLSKNYIYLSLIFLIILILLFLSYLQLNVKQKKILEPNYEAIYDLVVANKKTFQIRSSNTPENEAQTNNNLVLNFTAQCWIEIYFDEKLIKKQLFLKGESIQVKVEKPFKVIVGNADAVIGSYNNEVIDFTTYANRLRVSTIELKNE